MTIFIAKNPKIEIVVLQVRASGDRMVGDLFIDVHPGEYALGKSYEEWASIDRDRIELAQLP